MYIVEIHGLEKFSACAIRNKIFDEIFCSADYLGEITVEIYTTISRNYHGANRPFLRVPISGEKAYEIIGRLKELEMDIV